MGYIAWDTGPLDWRFPDEPHQDVESLTRKKDDPPWRTVFQLWKTPKSQAEGEGFEPSWTLARMVFETSPIDQLWHPSRTRGKIVGWNQKKENPAGADVSSSRILRARSTPFEGCSIWALAQESLSRPRRSHLTATRKHAWFGVPV